MSAIILADKVTKQFIQGSTTISVLNGISASFNQGNTYAISGVSGAGKSTFLHLLAGLDMPSSGSIVFNGRDLATMQAAERDYFLNKSIGLVFQLPYLINELSVLENVMLKGLIARLPKEECRIKALGLLEIVGLAQKAECIPNTLSGGQQQRVAIVRALFNEPTFLLADEPTGNLDEKTGQGVIDFILDCQKQWHMGLIISSHDAYVVRKMKQVLILHNGVLQEVR
ncbi:MAG TPA: ABC transporter ATP-binding protein [Candidatus Babeliales bacterium]|nr:ABC transporter ATP-binding protein [Candidatus Babeliales bacterium]